MSNIRLSKKHGLNPSLALCFWCGKENGDIILPGRLPGDAEAPRAAIWNYEPCAACRAQFAQGIHVYEVENDRPTGRCVVLRREAIERMFDEPLRTQILTKGKATTDKEWMDMLLETAERKDWL